MAIPSILDNSADHVLLKTILSDLLQSGSYTRFSVATGYWDLPAMQEIICHPHFDNTVNLVFSGRISIHLGICGISYIPNNKFLYLPRIQPLCISCDLLYPLQLVVIHRNQVAVIKLNQHHAWRSPFLSRAS